MLIVRGLPRHSSGELLPIQEAADELGVHVVTLYRLRKQGLIQRQPRRPKDRRSYVDMGEARHAVNPTERVTLDRRYLEQVLEGSAEPKIQALLAKLRAGEL